MTEKEVSLKDLTKILKDKTLREPDKLRAIRQWQTQFTEKIEKRIKHYEELSKQARTNPKCARCDGSGQISCADKFENIGKFIVLEEEVLGEEN